MYIDGSKLIKNSEMGICIGVYRWVYIYVYRWVHVYVYIDGYMYRCI